MNKTRLHIVNAVRIKNQKIFVNGSLAYEYTGHGNFLNDTYEALDNNYPKFYKMDALGKLGMIATNLLLENSTLPEKYKPEEIGIVLSNKNASIEADVNYFESAKTFPSPALFVYTLPNIVIGEISIRYKFKGENAFFISEKFDAEWLSFYVTYLIQQRKIKACVCGWIDVVNEKHETCLFLIEKDKTVKGLNFTIENIDNIYNCVTQH